MDGYMISGIALNVVFAAIALYALYLVVRAAVRDGIGMARAKEDARAQASRVEGAP